MQFMQAAATAVLTAVGVPAGVVSVAAPIIGQAALSAAVTVGLGALTRAQLPDPQSALVSMRQPRPPRRYMMGLPSRAAGAFVGGAQ